MSLVALFCTFSISFISHLHLFQSTECGGCTLSFLYVTVSVSLDIGFLPACNSPRARRIIKLAGTLYMIDRMSSNKYLCNDFLDKHSKYRWVTCGRQHTASGERRAVMRLLIRPRNSITWCDVSFYLLLLSSIWRNKVTFCTSQFFSDLCISPTEIGQNVPLRSRSNPVQYSLWCADHLLNEIWNKAFVVLRYAP